MRRFISPLLILPALAASAVFTPVWAHHSFAMFSMEKSVTQAGTVTQFNWVNPHSSMHLDVADDKGAVSDLAIEMTSPNNLINGGWRRSSLKPGDKIEVTYHPLANGKPGGSLISVKTADGKVLENK